MPGIETEWLSVEQAAKYVGISKSVIRAAVDSGDLDARVKPYATETRGKKPHIYRKISRTDLDAWVRSWPPARFGGRL